jgi:hypothetical protein
MAMKVGTGLSVNRHVRGGEAWETGCCVRDLKCLFLGVFF